MKGRVNSPLLWSGSEWLSSRWIEQMGGSVNVKLIHTLLLAKKEMLGWWHRGFTEWRACWFPGLFLLDFGAFRMMGYRGMFGQYFMDKTISKYINCPDKHLLNIYCIPDNILRLWIKCHGSCWWSTGCVRIRTHVWILSTHIKKKKSQAWWNVLEW